MTNDKITVTEIFGDFSDDPPVSREGLKIVFSPSFVPLKQRWQTNGLSADFMADYFAIFFPDNGSSTFETKKVEIKSAISFIANELIENAMKFSDETSQQPVSITLQLYNNKLVFLAENSVNSQAVGEFRTYLQELMTFDPGELYMCRLETNTSDEKIRTSRLGLLTMMNDYLAKIGWKFETIQADPEIITVTTMVQLMV